MNPIKMFKLLICKSSTHWVVPAARAGAAVLYLQTAFLPLCPLEPVTLWTGAQEKAEWERGGVGSPVSGVPSLCAEEESEALAPNSAHA